MTSARSTRSFGHIRARAKQKDPCEAMPVVTVAPIQARPRLSKALPKPTPAAATVAKKPVKPPKPEAVAAAPDDKAPKPPAGKPDREKEARRLLSLADGYLNLKMIKRAKGMYNEILTGYADTKALAGAVEGLKKCSSYSTWRKSFN